MCGSCVTNAEALILGAAGATSGGLALARSAADRLAGRRRGSRQVDAYEANARFLRTLGHDPTAVLGPAPEPDPVRPTGAAVRPVGALLGA